MHFSKKNYFIILYALLLTCIISSSWAAKPLWTILPQSPNTLTIPANQQATVNYLITNQSLKSHTLDLKYVQGISQNTDTSGYCSSPFILEPHTSCILSLIINAQQLASNTLNGGPVICDSNNSLQCYQANTSNQLHITRDINLYSISGTLQGLINGRTLVLQNNGTDTLTLTSNGSFSFNTQLATNEHYSISVLNNPNDETCTINNGTGTVNNTNINTIRVTCSVNSHTVGGTVNNLSGTLTLLNNGTDMLTINSNGTFTFPTPLAEGSDYNVTVGTSPNAQQCTISNATGTIGFNNVTDIVVTCATSYTVGGIVQGLNGTITLANNGEQIGISANGNYVFNNTYLNGAAYNVTLVSQPANQSCQISNSSGTINGNNVDNITVNCRNIFAYVSRGNGDFRFYQCTLTPNLDISSCNLISARGLGAGVRVNPSNTYVYTGWSTIGQSGLPYCSIANDGTTSCFSTVVSGNFNAPVDLVFNKSGSIVYVTNRGASYLSSCSVDPSSGLFSNCVQAVQQPGGQTHYLAINKAATQIYIGGNGILKCIIANDSTLNSCVNSNSGIEFNGMVLNPAETYLYAVDYTNAYKCPVASDGSIGACISMGNPIPSANRLIAITINRQGSAAYLVYYGSQVNTGIVGKCDISTANGDLINCVTQISGMGFPQGIGFIN